jgi:hypothetical protein
VIDGAGLRPDWSDIYYNSPSRLFWTHDPAIAPTAYKEVPNPDGTTDPIRLPGTAMGFATSLEASGFEAAEQGFYSSMPSSGDYTIRYPKLNNNLQRNFPDGDFDVVALNYIRCQNYYVPGKKLFGAKKSGVLWASHFFGPNLGNPGNLYPQFNCVQFMPPILTASPPFLGWETPANNTTEKYSGSTPPSSLVAGKQAAFSRFWVRQDAGGFGADSGESLLGGQTFVTVEAARMAISSNLDSIGGSGTFLIPSTGITLRPMKPLDSLQDNADEEQRWISGVEFQRSAALITLFKLLQHPTLSQTYDVSLLLNNPSEATAASGLTTYTRYPTDPIIKGTLSDPTQSNFKDVMKHLYGMNRLLGDVSSPPFGPSFTNPGNEHYRHLANKGTFDVKAAITNFREMVANTGTHYDHFVNVIYFPSDMSGNATVTNPSKIPTGPDVGKLSNEDDLKKHLGIDPPTLPSDPQMIPTNIMDEVAPTNDDLKGKITYVLVVHMDTYDLFKDRVKWLAKEMGKKDVKVIYKEVKGIYDQPPARDDYEAFVDDTLLEKLKHIQGTVTPGSLFNQMGKEQYSY